MFLPKLKQSSAYQGLESIKHNLIPRLFKCFQLIRNYNSESISYESKSYRSIFCRIQSEFFEIQHSKPNAKFVYLRLVEFTKNTHVSQYSYNFLS